MNLRQRDRLLSWVLVAVGLVFTFGLWPLTALLPGSWLWEPRQSEYEQMILGIYAVLGIFLIRASRHPSDHRSLISFTAWSSIVHGLIMLVQALRDPIEKPNLFGDIPAILFVGVVLVWLSPRKDEVSSVIR